MGPPPERLRLPGPRQLWWLLTLLAISLPIALEIGHDDPAPGLAQTQRVELDLRVHTLMWRFATRLGTAPTAERMRDVSPAPLPSQPTVTTRDPAEALLGQVRERNAKTATENARALFYEALKADAARVPVQPKPSNRKTLAPHHSAERVIAWCVATQQDGMAAELARSLTVVTDDLRTALAALPDPVTSTALAQRPDLLLPPQQAATLAQRGTFGSEWSAYTRDRIRLRLLTRAEDLLGARDLGRRLHEQDGRMVAGIGALVQILLLAGVLGLAMLIAAAVRALAARQRGDATWGWLRARQPGLPEDVPYRHDPLVPLLGFAAWLLGYLAAALVTSLLGGPRSAAGLATLFQAGAGVLLAQAVVQALAKQPPGLQTAARLGGEQGFWKASTAALRAFCVLLPTVLLAAMVGVGLFGDSETTPHRVALHLLEDADPIQLLAFGVAAVVAAPVGEELLFRGFLYRALRQHVGLARALWLSALLFAILHFSPAYLPPYVTLGLAFALVYEWSGSLWSSIVLHGLWNLMVFSWMAALALS